MKTYFANFDFEECLNQDDFHPPRYSPKTSKLEHIFFWLSNDDEELYSEISYSADYLSFIEECRGKKVNLTNENKKMALPWWGNYRTKDEWEQEKKINSNLTLHKARVELELNSLNSKVCFTKEDAVTYKEESPYPVLFKEMLSFSGRGLRFEISEEMTFPILAERLVQRVRDFGMRMTEEGSYLVQNLIDRKGGYKGSLVRDKFEEESEVLSFGDKIFSYYKDRFSLKALQIDSFQYLDDGVLKYQPLCEVNHRRSMGELAWKLHKDFGNNVSMVAMVPRKKLKTPKDQKTYLSDLGGRLYKKGVNKGVIPLSPVDSGFRLFFLTEETERTLQHLVKDWFEFEAKSGEKLPSEFVVYF